MTTNVTLYRRSHVRHPSSDRIIATVTRVGEMLHLDMPLKLRLDEARLIGEQLELWGYPSYWGDADQEEPRDQESNGEGPDVA